jgi:flavorubredoxin
MPRVYVDKVVEDLYILRVDDDETRYFEALWSIPEGITYNSYVLLTSEGAVVFDTWKHTYADLYVKTLRRVVDLRDVKYIVTHHTEPDHSGSLPKLLEVTGNAPTVLGHPIAKQLISAFYGIEPRFRAVKDLEELVVGGKKLRFIYIPWLHWPDTIATYIADYGALLTCDAFGGFGLPKTLYDDDEAVVEWYKPFVRKYVVDIVGHYREYIVKNIEKIRSLNIDVKIVAPAHGLVWRRNPKEVIDLYYDIGSAKPSEGKVLVVYSSMYGIQEKSMNIVIEELRARGFKTVTHKFTDREHASLGDVLADAIDAEAIVIGISTYDAAPFALVELVIKLLVEKVNAEKPVLIITTFGWGKLSEDTIKNLFSSSRFRIVDIVSVRGAPQKSDVERLKQGVEKLVNSIRK